MGEFKMATKVIKGFSHLTAFPVTKNTSEAYAVGDKVAIPGAIKCTMEPKISEYTLWADDGKYEYGSNIEGFDMTLEIAEATQTIKKLFEGGTITDDDEYETKSTDLAPENALTFAVLQADNTYKMVKLYATKAEIIGINATTKGENVEFQTLTVKIAVSERKIDHVIKTEKDADTVDDLDWLDTIDALPVVPPTSGSGS
jgi:phi13 family phage major tail protein